MDSRSLILPIVFIVGPTASGKTDLAVELAQQCGGEIICADSRTVYKEMDIGTAKPNKEIQKKVPHWGIDLVSPGEHFSAADFKYYADQKIEEIRSRGNVPFVVGGTGLYVDAVLFDYQFGEKSNEDLRQKLQHMTLEQLHQYCLDRGITLPENHKNKRYVVRAIENEGRSPHKANAPLENSIIVGITTEKGVLRDRIANRTEQLFEDGVVEEAKMLGKKYGWESEAMKSNIYPLIKQFLASEITLGDVKNKFITLDWRLAKRQMTWLRRNTFIHWLPLNDARNYIIDQLAIYR